MEKKLIQELEPLSQTNFTPFSKPSFSNSDLFAMHRVLAHCVESFTDYLEKSKEPIRFTDNVVPLKKEFMKFIHIPDGTQTLFGEL
ncbi:MAG: hypothetical protein IPL26_16395 [Leptospiraceae bacterium]|nr:hypothetical protein [Leptospiraceae bacterium]